MTEEGGTQRWQPITLTLAARLSEHAQARGAATPNDALLRYRNGRPATYRHYDLLWARIGRRLSWIAAQGITTHWLRHTTLTWVERHFGYGVARAHAGPPQRTTPRGPLVQRRRVLPPRRAVGDDAAQHGHNVQRNEMEHLRVQAPDGVDR
ncbi:hypothetical protein [Micromonospora sp. NPDC005710]|uniref:hypothetical protein n=1 Tax=Micromonospora sp. NPDC005710 TaxID=3157051 RepID=UPI0033DC46F4